MLYDYFSHALFKWFWSAFYVYPMECDGQDTTGLCKDGRDRP